MVQSRKEHSKQTVCTDVAYNTRASLIPVLVYADLTAFWQNLRQKKGMYYFSIWKYKALTTLQKLTAKLQKVFNTTASCHAQYKLRRTLFRRSRRADRTARTVSLRLLLSLLSNTFYKYHAKLGDADASTLYRTGVHSAPSS
jgi:hypothetical protein